MKNLVWLVLIVLGMAACRGASTGATTSTLPITTMTGGFDLIGLEFEVHQAPG